MTDPHVLTIPLHEEYLTTAKREVVTSVAQVRKTVDTESASISLDVTRERADVERVSVAPREVAADTQPYWDGDTYVVPVVEEELVVTKRLIVREEVRIRKARGTETVSVPVTVRRERVEVNEIAVNSNPDKHSHH